MPTQTFETTVRFFAPHIFKLGFAFVLLLALGTVCHLSVYSLMPLPYRHLPVEEGKRKLAENPPSWLSKAVSDEEIAGEQLPPPPDGTMYIENKSLTSCPPWFRNKWTGGQQVRTQFSLLHSLVRALSLYVFACVVFAFYGTQTARSRAIGRAYSRLGVAAFFVHALWLLTMRRLGLMRMEPFVSSFLPEIIAGVLGVFGVFMGVKAMWNQDRLTGLVTILSGLATLFSIWIFIGARSMAPWL